MGPHGGLSITLQGARLKVARRQRLNKMNLTKSYLSEKADCLYRQTAGSWNGVATLGGVIICDHVSATRRFCYVL
jgi:hypothetical protein